MKFSDYLIGNQWGQQMSSQVQTPIQPQQMQSIAPQQSMQSSVTDFWIKPNQSAPKKKAETFDVLWMLEKTNQFTQQAIKDNPAPVKLRTEEESKALKNKIADYTVRLDKGVESIRDEYDIPKEDIIKIWDEYRQYLESKWVVIDENTTTHADLAYEAIKNWAVEWIENKERSAFWKLIQWWGDFLAWWAEEHYNDMMNEWEQIKKRVDRWEQWFISTKLQEAGSVAWFASDLIWDAVIWAAKWAWNAINYITAWNAWEVATAIGNKIKNTPLYNEVVSEWLKYLWQGIESYNQRKQANPEAWANVDALINVVDLWSMFIWWWAVKKAWQEVIESWVARTIKEWVETWLQKGAKWLWNIGKTAGGIVEWFGNKVSWATDYAAKKLIDSKFKLTKTNKDAIRKSAWVEPSEFILENNIGGNNIDEMVENTKSMVDDAMQTKFQALSEVKELQPITQREKLIWQSIVKQAKWDIEEIYGKKFDEILDDEIVPELKEQFTIVKNIEKVINEKEISPLQLEALKSLYDIYNSHLKYDLTKKRVLWAAEKIRLWLQETIEWLWEQVWVDIKWLNKKIAWGKALEKWLIQAWDRLDNNNLFWLSDSQTAILSSALWGGWLEVASVLWVKSLFENIWLRNKLARSLYTKKTPNVWPKIPNNTSSIGTTARSNITKQFGDSSSVVNGVKPTVQVKTKWLSNLKDQWDMPKIPAKTPKELPAKQNIADTTPTTVKKKPVQSNTLVSKADEMGNKRYIDKIESTEKTKLPISESEMKRNNLTPIKNLKWENTWRYENKSLNQWASNRTIYSKEWDIVTFKKDDAYKIGYAIDNQIENNYTVPKWDIVTTDLYKSKDLQPLYDEAKKRKKTWK